VCDDVHILSIEDRMKVVKKNIQKSL